MASASVEKLSALLERVRHNRTLPRERGVVAAAPAVAAPTAAQVAAPAPAAVAPTPAAAPSRPVSEVRDLDELPPAAERKKPAPSPLELAVGSTVDKPSITPAPVAATPVAAPEPDIEVEDEPDIEVEDEPFIELSGDSEPAPALAPEPARAPADEPKVEIEPPSLAPEPAQGQVAPLVSELLVAAPLAASGAVAKTTAAFVAEQPKTFGALLERTLSLRIR